MVDFRPSTTNLPLPPIEKFLCASMPSVEGVVRRSPEKVSLVYRSIAIDVIPTPDVEPPILAEPHEINIPSLCIKFDLEKSLEDELFFNKDPPVSQATGMFAKEEERMMEREK
ncbi:hypothetical protein TNCV_187471 [Trichonephila clavipes]|nr:hypothetical protein TNCV_187471 [Trichonephila clavipes]